MANPLKGQVDVELNGKSYKARLTVDSIIDIEDSLNIGLLKLAQNMAGGDVRISQVVGVLLPALRGGGNDLQDKQVRILVQNAGLVQSTKVVADLIAQSLLASGDPDEKKSEQG